MLSSFVLRADKALAGAPDEMLTAGLLGIAGLCVIIALLGRPAEKATALCWTLLP